MPRKFDPVNNEDDLNDQIRSREQDEDGMITGEASGTDNEPEDPSTNFPIGCLPLIIAVVLAILINVYPHFRAFVIGDESFVRAGWALYFLTIPVALVLIFIGLVTTLIWTLNKRQHQTQDKCHITNPTVNWFCKNCQANFAYGSFTTDVRPKCLSCDEFLELK